MSWQHLGAYGLGLSALMLVVSCAENNDDSFFVSPTTAPTPTPSPAPVSASSVEEALSISDEDYDYAAVFENSGRGGF